jgi:AhpD family alkylhydroperoxidase
MNHFRKRIYSVPGFFHDIFVVLKKPALALGVLFGNSLPHRFRERLFLAVIAVNGCRYCTYLHTRSALHAGLTQDDVNRLLTGVIDNVPMEEAKAILYAQHWADTKGFPAAQARTDLLEAYGTKLSRAIEMALLLIQIGSLCGNSFDFCLFRLSRGRWGLTKRGPS